jgi:DNA polymerase-3 subunit delta'
MERAATRGQPEALAAISAMVRGTPPHAVLLVGPASSGKTTLALDLAAGLLCLDPDPAARPCRSCRGCRQVASGNHPDVHRLSPEGPGGQIRIGKPTDPEPGTVRRLISELALLSAEGGARVALVEQAHRLNEDAQNALLKVLEEPPSGVTIVLCADDEECLLPTVRSRCARVRLGSVSGREIERWLGELGAADAPAAARYARLAEGAPGLALAYARAPEAARLRDEISRGLLDMLTAGRHDRLVAVRALMASAGALDVALDEGRRGGEAAGDEIAGREPGRKSGRRGKAAAARAGDGEATGGDEATPGDAPRPAASDRRAAAATLLAIWASVARDLAVAGLGGKRQLRYPDLVDELTAAAPAIPAATLAAFLDGLNRVSAQLDDNVNPELALDVLALAWPRPAGAGSGAGGAGAPAAAAARGARR